MMDNLYKLEEYSGELPNPKSFPIRGSSIIAIRDMPNTFSDGFMLDLLVRESDKEILEEKVVRTVGDVSSLFNEASKAKLLLSEPEFIRDISYPAYVMFAPKGNPVLMQVKYYRYFRNRYKECKFYIRDEDAITTIAIKVGEEVVGLCMPEFYEKETLNKIMEARKGG